jgi:O-antigen/teichoic acid export membrane protein
MSEPTQRSGQPAAASGVGGWFLRGSWAVLDQALFSISNFALQVLLARWLDARDYGAFAVAFSWFLLVGNVHTALLTEPALILAPGTYASSQPAYFRAVVRLNAELLALIVVGMLYVPLVFWVRGEGPLARAFVAIALAAPAVLSVWLARRLCYAVFQPRAAAVGGAVYLVVMVAGIYGCYAAGVVSLWTGCAMLALASVAGGLVTVRAIPLARSRISADEVKDVRAAHWRLGGWLLASSPLRWAPSNLVYFLLPLLPGPDHGLEASGMLRAAMNMVTPLLQAYTALATLLLPTFSSDRQVAARPRAARFAAVFVAGGLVYWVVLIAFGDQIMELVYGTGYRGAHRLLWILGALPMLTGLVGVLQGIVLTAERPRQVFTAFLVATAVSVSLGSALCIWLGTEGAALGNLAAYACLAVAFGVFVVRNRREIASR